MAVDRVHQIADPNKPNAHAYESAPPFGRSREPLERDHVVYVVAATTIGGTPYWQVADSDFIGCCAPFGWIPARTQDTDTLAPLTPTCLTAQPLKSADVLTLGARAALVCYRGGDVTLEGLLKCVQPTVDAAAFVQSPWEADPVYPLECSVDDEFYALIGLALRPFLQQGHTLVTNVVLTGHFDDPGSSKCIWIEGDMSNIVPPEGGPNETAQFNCRLTFVVTQVDPV